MSNILILLRRDWVEFKNIFLNSIICMILIPIMLHIFLSVPLSSIVNMEIRYLNWSVAGVWIVSSSLVALLASSISLFRNNIEGSHINGILQTPVANIELLLVNIIKGLCYGIFQFLISVIITSILNSEYLNLIQLLLIFSQIVILLIFFSSLGVVLGLSISNLTIYIYIVSIVLLIVSFGLGAFIPLNYYPMGFVSVIQKIPLVSIINNIQFSITNDPFQWIGYFLTIFAIIIMLILSLIISYRVLRRL